MADKKSIVRRAVKDDFNSLKEIKLLSKKEELKYSESIKPIDENKEDYFRYLKKDLKYINRGLFMALSGDRVVGMILAQYYSPLPISKYCRKGYISNLFVVKDFREKGIAKKLIEKGLEWLKKNKTKHVSLEIHVDNKAALKIYRKYGFKDYTLKLSKEI
jgi:ribosomal protein S18 acetylase RimI-like enzyme